MKAAVRPLLGEIPYFWGLDDEELDRLIETGHEETYAAGEVVFREGEQGDVLYVVLEGSVEIFRDGHDGPRVVFAQPQEGGFFGELALFDNSPRSASACAASPARLFLLGRDDFLDLLSRHPRILSEVLRTLSDKLRVSSHRVVQSVLQKEYERAQAEIARHRAISEMVAGVAHEINTPIGIVNSAASIVTETLTGETIQALAQEEGARETLESVVDACRLIQSNIERASRLIHTFKHLSAHHARERLEEADLVELTEQVLEMFRITGKRAGVRAALVNELGSQRLWTGYPGHYTQVLLNLLTNVERYAYPDNSGGIAEVRLAVIGAPAFPKFEVSVRDEGVGIAEGDRDRVFDAFFTTGRDRGGTGLGLSIAHSLVTQSLRGDISVDSKPGAGTRVVFRFPVTIAELEEPRELHP